MDRCAACGGITDGHRCLTCMADVRAARAVVESLKPSVPKQSPTVLIGVVVGMAGLALYIGVAAAQRPTTAERATLQRAVPVSPPPVEPETPPPAIVDGPDPSVEALPEASHRLSKPGRPGWGGFACATKPLGAEVWIDGKNTGERTPVTLSRAIALKTGKHRVQFKLNGKSTQLHAVEIDEGVVSTLTGVALPPH